MDIASSTSAAEKKDKVEKDCCKVICGAPRTFQVYGIELYRILNTEFTIY